MAWKRKLGEANLADLLQNVKRIGNLLDLSNENFSSVKDHYILSQNTSIF